MGWMRRGEIMDGDANHDLITKVIDDVKYNFYCAFGREPNEHEAVDLSQRLRAELVERPVWLDRALDVLALTDQHIQTCEKIKILTQKNGDKKLSKILEKYGHLKSYERHVKGYYYKCVKGK